MNCQDIARLIDQRGFGSLTDTERRDAGAHARSCAHCLPLWSAHAHVAAMPVPSLPQELAMRWRVPAARVVPAAVKSAMPRGRMVVIAGLVALAAAAAMLLVDTADAPAPHSSIVIAGSPPAAPVAMPLMEIPAPRPATPAVVGALPTDAPQRALPRLPAPQDSDQLFLAQRDQALQKLVELYPELVQGPPTEESFVAAIVLRADGQVLRHALQGATRETSRQVSTELGRLLPRDGGDAVLDLARKGTQLPDGRALRGNLSFHHLTVPASYDPSRSNLRVEELVRARSAPAFPPGADGVNYLTVLLSDSGAVLREDLEFIGLQEVQQRRRAGAAEQARGIARRLGIDVEQIGLVGFTSLPDGTEGRQMHVDYGWQRRAGEAVVPYRQVGTASFAEQDGVNMTWALALVEQVMPEAFVPAAPEMGIPVVVLTQEGELIRTGRLKARTDITRQMQELVPGQVIESGRMVTLQNGKGEQATVYFAWQASSEKREEIQKARSKAASGG